MQYYTFAAVFLALHHGSHALWARSRVDLDGIDAYSFVQFVREYGRSYTAGSAEYSRRLELFEQSRAAIKARNAQNRMDGKSWHAGVHPFMDWSSAERKVLNGYKPAASRHNLHRGVSLLHEHALGGSHSLSNQTSPSMGGMSVESGPSLRNQGNCGSCWAISAVEAVEAHLQRKGVSPTPRLSAQALVDCVPNPQHCGGSGGCDGATGELAYAFMRDYGIPLENDLAYTAKTQSCPQQPLSGPWPSAKRARVAGWKSLPSNQAAPVMQALVNEGPVVVAVDGNNWFDYDSGVFDSCDKDAILGHAVLAKGYGTDEGKKYWLIQNSWGSGWGEQGHIRLLMHDDEEQWCGIDSKPKEGVGCDGGPPQVTVCGTCGILYDPIIPTGVRLEGGDEAVGNPGQFTSDPFMPGASEPMDNDVASFHTPQAAVATASPEAPDVVRQSPEQQMDALLRRFNTQ
mmetsp:Transcript_10466/g.20179  ORF Transcript_10466/g.20179 Transcript_10466/m.20179 type:complete len:457 (+) Transcript_10466:66-1436(+)